MGATERSSGWWEYAVSCFSSDYSSVVCHDYWNWVADGAFAIAGLIIALVGWSLFRQYSAFWRGRQHLWEEKKTRNARELEAMEAKFRAALERRKAELQKSGLPPLDK